jgi:N-acetylmuramoyl-L-alanine amidase
MQGFSKEEKGGKRYLCWKSRAFMRHLFFILLIFNTLLISAQNNPREVTAQEGDGIHKLLGRYGLDSTHYVKQFLEINSSKLGQNQWLYAGNRYLLPADPRATPGTPSSSSATPAESPTQATFEIFGPRYAVTAINDQTLKGAVFYIVAGHGGPDPGAEGFREGKQMCEDEYAYDVALRLCRELISRGARAYMIVRDSTDGIRDEAFLVCDNDEFLIDGSPIPRNHLARLKQRAEVINRLYLENSQSSYHRLIELHIDSRHKGQRVDVFFYHHSRSKKGSKLAERIHASFSAMYAKHQPERGYKGTVTSRDELYMISNTLPPAVYIELGNIQNDADQIRFIRWENRQALAKWISEGIVKDYEQEKR